MGISDPPSSETLEVRVVDIEMSFGSMVIFMVKATLAAIPAMIILALIGAAIALVFGTFFAIGRGAPLSAFGSSAADHSSILNDAYAEAMRSELRNVGIAEEAFFNVHHEFTQDMRALGYHPIPDVTVTFDRASADAWSARATSPGSDQECSIAGDRFTPSMEPRCAGR